MLQINVIRDQKEEVIARLGIKNFPAKELIDNVLEIDSQRRTTQSELDNLLAAQNTLAKQVGDLFKSGKQAEANDLKNKSTALKEESKLLGDRLTELEKQMNDILYRIPNLPSAVVPAGKTPEDNEIVFQSVIYTT
jgi:seryl-tRNA synthetase